MSKLKNFLSNNNINFLKYFFISTFLSINQIITVKFISIFYIFFLKKIRFDFNDKIILFIILKIFFINILFLSNPIIDIIKVLRFFFGFYFFYFIFKNINRDFISLRIILYLSITAIFLEFILFNFFAEFFGIINYEKYINKIFINLNYDKPLGLGFNSTISAAIIVLIAFNINLRFYENIIVAFSILLLNSGVGYCSYFLYVIIKLIERKNFLTLILIVISILTIINIGVIEKIDKNSFYIYFLMKKNFIFYHLVNYFDIKVFLMSDLVEYVYDYGNYGQLGYGGEMPYIYFILKLGILGLVALMFIFFEVKKNCSYKFIFLILISILHYPFICNYYGQIVFGYLIFYLSMRKSHIKL